MTKQVIALPTGDGTTGIVLPKQDRPWRLISVSGTVTIDALSPSSVPLVLTRYGKVAITSIVAAPLPVPATAIGIVTFARMLSASSASATNSYLNQSLPSEWLGPEDTVSILLSDGLTPDSLTDWVAVIERD